MPPPLKKLIKRADIMCAAQEAVQLAGFGQSEADTIFGPVPREARLDLVPQSPTEAQMAYLERFHALERDL